jgi:hypothetical protein
MDELAENAMETRDKVKGDLVLRWRWVVEFFLRGKNAQIERHLAGNEDPDDSGQLVSGSRKAAKEFFIPNRRAAGDFLLGTPHRL